MTVLPLALSQRIGVHVFLAETREYYDLERLWTDAPRIAWEPTGREARAV